MKQIGNRSLITVLGTAVNLFWWLEWIGGFVCLGLGALAAYFRRGFALQIPISFSDVTVSTLHSIKSPGPVGALNSTNGILIVNIDASWQNIGMLLFGYGLIFAVIVTLTYQFKKILQNLKRNQPFHKSNMSRIKIIAIVLISYSFIQWLFVLAVNHTLTSIFRFDHFKLTYDFNASCLLIGIILLVVEGIFRAGLSLEEEQQLTI